MASRMNFVDAMITLVVCFAAGYRKKILQMTNVLPKFDVHCRKLFRRVVGPPPDIDWNQPWHTLLHAWHNRVDQELRKPWLQDMVNEIFIQVLKLFYFMKVAD